LRPNPPEPEPKETPLELLAKEAAPYVGPLVAMKLGVPPAVVMSFLGNPSGGLPSELEEALGALTASQAPPDDAASEE
ncbi:MAG: hypothetical protein V3U45_07100, partial [bacterium]